MTKIYVIGYYTGKNSYGVIQDAGPDGDVMGQAFIIRDGRVVYIEYHYSSGAYWYRHDMGITSDWKHDTYKEYCPDGYELIDLGVYKNLEEMDARIDEVSKAGANNG